MNVSSVIFISDCEQVQPPLWLQTLMNACKQASNFSVQGVTISLVMDLVGLTQSVALVTGENLNSVETAQPLSPSQGRVAVVIRPPLTQGNLRYMAEKTDFFKVQCSISLLFSLEFFSWLVKADSLGHFTILELVDQIILLSILITVATCVRL